MITKAQIESAENGYVVWLGRRMKGKDEASARYIFVTLPEAMKAVDLHFAGKSISRRIIAAEKDH